jgi:hypothetical protein
MLSKANVRSFTRPLCLICEGGRSEPQDGVSC